MFGSVILDVAIGMSLIYLLFSLISSAVAESIASKLKWRSKELETGIQKMLTDAGGADFAARFYDHPLIKGLIDKSGNKPSYISSHMFSLALMDMVISDIYRGINTVPELLDKIHENNALSDDLKRTLTTLIGGTETDLSKAKANIEKWFDDGMDRVSGWYKRNIQSLIWVISAIVVIFFNVDSMKLINTLYQDKTMREELVAVAQDIAKQTPPPAAVTSVNTLISASPATPASDSSASMELLGKIKDQTKEIKLPFGPDTWQPWLEYTGKQNNNITLYFYKFLGLLISAAAIGMGAPFWFDILGKLINLRSAGIKPGKGSENKNTGGSDNATPTLNLIMGKTITDVPNTAPAIITKTLIPPRRDE